MRVGPGLAVTALTWLVATGLVSGQPAGSEARPLDDGRQWLESRPATAGATPAIVRGAIAVAFNDALEAEKLLLAVIRAEPTSAVTRQAYELLSRLYLRSGRYRRLSENLDAWARAFPDDEGLRSERVDVGFLRGLPDQITEVRRSSTLSHKPGDDFSLPVSVNGRQARYLVDSGAWLSSITEAEAHSLGLRIRAGTGTIGDASGRGVTVRTAVADDVRIGAIRLRNVTFVILPSNQRGGLLGIPVLLALERLRWSRGGGWEVGYGAKGMEHHPVNVVFSGNHLLLSVKVLETDVFMTLDTGAVATDLNLNFANQFADLVARSGTKSRREITGLGGTSDVEGVTLAELGVEIAGTPRLLRPAHLTLQQNPALGGDCCIGNIGRDLLTQAQWLTIDLAAMTLQLK